MKEEHTMRRILPIIALSLAWGGSMASAADRYDPDTSVGVGLSKQQAEHFKSGLIRDEVAGATPQFGLIAFEDPLGNTTSRLAAGFTADLNAVPLVDNTWKEYFAGFTTGLIYSHLGSASSNFFGADADFGFTPAGANLVVIPTDLKVGYHTDNNARYSLHAGGNVVYRSVGSSIDLGSSSTTSDSVWRIFPNVGAAFEYGFGGNVVLAIRPDFTFTPGNTLFTGTMGLGILLS